MAATLWLCSCRCAGYGWGRIARRTPPAIARGAYRARSPLRSPRPSARLAGGTCSARRSSGCTPPPAHPRRPGERIGDRVDVVRGDCDAGVRFADDPFGLVALRQCDDGPSRGEVLVELSRGLRRVARREQNERIGRALKLDRCSSIHDPQVLVVGLGFATRYETAFVLGELPGMARGALSSPLRTS